MYPDDRWRDTFDWCGTIGSFIVTLVFGVGFANFFIGMPVAGNPPHMTQSFLSLFSPFALLGGVMLVVLFTIHGAVFLSLKTKGIVHEKAVGYTDKMGWVAVALLALFVICGNVFYPASDNPWIEAGHHRLLGSWHRLGAGAGWRNARPQGSSRRLGIHLHRPDHCDAVRDGLREDVRYSRLHLGSRGHAGSDGGC